MSRRLSELRLVVISRRFWPLVGGAETVVGNLAGQWVQAGCQVDLLTARWEPHWPARMNDHNGVCVHRLAQPKQRFWGTWRYMSGVSRWLREHTGDYDLIYVSMLKHDAYAALTTATRHPVPVVLRAEGAGPGGDIWWQRTANFGRRIRRRCLEANCVIAPSQNIQDELLAAGYRPEKIVRLPNGVPLPGPEEFRPQPAARATLAASQLELQLPVDARLVVFTGRFHPVKGLRHLIDAWPQVLKGCPKAYLWLVGDGDQAGELRQRIRELGLFGRVVLAGPFDKVDDCLLAADVFVLPSLEEGMSLALLEAMAYARAVVATDIPGNREVLAGGAPSGLLVEPGRAETLAAAILRLLNDRELAVGFGRAARERVYNSFSLERTAEEHLRLFEQITSDCYANARQVAY